MGGILAGIGALMGMSAIAGAPIRKAREAEEVQAADAPRRNRKRKTYRTGKGISRPAFMMPDPGEGASRQVRRQFARLLEKPGRAEGGVPALKRQPKRR